MLKNDKKTVLQVYENKKLAKREEFDQPSEAWDKSLEYAKDNTTAFGIISSEESVVEITLGSDWTCYHCLSTAVKMNIIVDLNGHYIKRDGKKAKDGSLFKIGESTWLTIRDSNPNSNGYKDHKGGVLADVNADDCGGGIIVGKNAHLYMYGGTLYNCKTDLHGGGIYNEGDNALIHLKNCTIDSCLTKDSGDDCHGGGIYVKNTTNLILENVTIKNCHSEDKGGGLYLREKPRNVVLKNVTFHNNYADDGGGAIFIDDLKSDTEFSFEAEKCTFTKNRANDNGGAVYINDDDEYGDKNTRNATIFRDCVFKENECTKYGGAIEANDNGVMLFGGTFTDNNAAGKGGAIYVEDAYDISVAGRLIIKNNDGKDYYDNLCLEETSKHKAYIYCAGLYEGSDVHISTSNAKTGFAAVKNVSEYQAKYFHADTGSLTFNKTGEKTAAMVTASLFGDGSVTVLAVFCGAALLAAAAALLIKKKKGVVQDDDNDEEE
jgi:predicted outer membrane repeat protein